MLACCDPGHGACTRSIKLCCIEQEEGCTLEERHYLELLLTNLVACLEIPLECSMVEHLELVLHSGQELDLEHLSILEEIYYWEGKYTNT